jgi:flagellar biosynthetic protein FlhB
VSAGQARGVLSLEPLKPDFSRISPIKGAAKIFGPRSLVELAKSLFKLLVIGLALRRGVEQVWDQVMSLGQQSPFALLSEMARAATGLLFAAGGAYLLIAGADYTWQLWQHEKQLRMTKEEVKQETKETEGDPLIKSRLRALGRSRLRKQMFDEVPNADVVVTNPTRIAVALRYDPLRAGAPLVVAMGQRKIAQRIRDLARNAGVPIIENKPLARALLKTARVGEPIPTDLYVAVAEVLAFVMKRRRAAGVVV